MKTFRNGYKETYSTSYAGLCLYENTGLGQNTVYVCFFAHIPPLFVSHKEERKDPTTCNSAWVQHGVMNDLLSKIHTLSHTTDRNSSKLYKLHFHSIGSHMEVFYSFFCHAVWAGFTTVSAAVILYQT